MDFGNIFNYLLTFIAGLGAGSLLTVKLKKNSKNQNGNTLYNSSMVNGPSVKGDNNNINENNGKE